MASLDQETMKREPPRRGVVWLAICALATASGCAARVAPPGDLAGAARQATEALSETAEEGPAETDWAAAAARRLPLLEPCRPEGFPEPVLCGTIEVFEDRAAGAGRKIPIKLIVVPARSADPPNDPVFVFEGGPGGAATGRALGSIYAGPVRERDIVLVDQRGTGGSNRLDCPPPAPSDGAPIAKLREMFPTAEVEACAEELAERADLLLYTSEHFADDVEEVRRRLGYGPINVRGGSYGTWAMMTFAQRHPGSTRSLFGIGLDSPARSNLAERGRWTDRTLARLAELCAAEARCGALTPELDGMVRDLLGEVAQNGKRVEMPDPSRPGETLVLDLERDWLAEQLRLVLYFAFTSRALPWAVHRAYEADDWQPLLRLALWIEGLFRSSLARGVLLTVQCSEMMGFDVDRALAEGAETLVGNYRLEQQLQGCAAWPHETRPPLGVAEPEVLDTPALFLSGALDPVTPPEYADEAAALFPSSRHLVLPTGQHGPFDHEGSWECVHRIWADFLDAKDPQAVDAGCLARLEPPPFVVDAEGFERWAEETLTP